MRELPNTRYNSQALILRFRAAAERLTQNLAEPWWTKLSIERTTCRFKDEIMRSASLLHK